MNSTAQKRANRRRQQQSPVFGWGTSGIGQIQTSYSHLKSCLGQPTICNRDIPGGYMRQTLYEWEIRTPVGPVTIYDYKEWEDPDFADEKVIAWNVGGRSEKYTRRQVHPVNKWVADQTGLPVLDRRPPHCRPASSIAPRTGPPDALDLLMEANRQAMALEVA
jgi:hypothetical protein